MRKSWLVIVLLAVSCQLSAVSFEKTYHSAPLYEVLQDLETHFGLQFLYRPADIAEAPPVTITLKTDDAQKALKQVLGASLKYTERNGILIITKVPPKPQKTRTRVRSVIEKETAVIVIPETLPEEEPREEWQAVPLLRPGEKLYVSPIDTLRIAQITQNTPKPQPAPKPRKTPRSLQEKGFYIGVSQGYGSALVGHMDLRFNYYFNRNWGIGAGLGFAGSGADRDGKWIHNVQIGFPIAAYTRWPLSMKWGIHGSVGVAPMFKIYNDGFANLDVDIVPFAELDAMRILSPKVTCIFGLFTRIGALGPGGDPWAIGIHLAFIIGK